MEYSRARGNCRCSEFQETPRTMAKRKAASNSGGKKKSAKSTAKRDIEQYEHEDKQRVNNPPVGLVTPSTDPPETAKKTYAYDPHLDPQLVWAGKAEHTSFEVPTVSLHVHERIDPCSIIEAVKSNGHSHEGEPRLIQQSLFAQPKENPPLREAIDFYKHPHGWSNRLIAGDSLLVMNSLLEKEGMAGKVQMVYIDPPYGIRYGSNFQPFVNRRDVKDGKDSDLSQEPEMIKAFRDTWELGLHSYLSYLRDRILLAKELLHDSGALFVQISDENLHHVREILDEVFGPHNFVSLIAFKKTTGATTTYVPATSDYLVFYAREKAQLKFRKLYEKQSPGDDGALEYKRVELADGTLVPLSQFRDANGIALPPGAEIFATDSIVSKGGDDPDIELNHEGRRYVLSCRPNRHWKPGVDGIKKLWEVGRLLRQEGLRIYKRYFNDFPYRELTHIWTDTRGDADPDYVVQTDAKVLERVLLMSTDPGDIVLDPTCGAGTTAFVAEQWGRRWITCDTSRVATVLTKQRLLTASFDYYELKQPNEGIGSGIRCHSVPHVTLGSIADNPYINGRMSRVETREAIVRYAKPETLFDKPYVDSSKVRVTGPFTVEAVPAPTVLPIDDVRQPPASDVSVARSGATLKQSEWRAEMAKTGVRAHGGKRVEFTRLEPLAGARYLHARGEITPPPQSPKSVRCPAQLIAVSFGPEHAPLEQRQVELAWEEARSLNPRPQILLFAAFHFDPEAAKDIDELDPQKAGMTFLRSQMNTDLLTDDLKKKRASNESFWLIGQPDVDLRKVKTGDDNGKWQVEIRGFDYYNPNTGQIESGNASRIAMWLLDTDYDGRSLFPRQVFFPMSGPKDGWARLAKSLKAEIDEDKIEAYRGTQSLPFAAGKHNRIAVKIVDDRGIESLKLLELT
jgi:adenine-specific DNA-methyltransferase